MADVELGWGLALEGKELTQSITPSVAVTIENSGDGANTGWIKGFSDL